MRQGSFGGARSRSWDRVVSAPSERVAAGDPPGAHDASPSPAVALDGSIRVLRAGRVVSAAAGEERRQAHLVAADDRQQQPGHPLTGRSRARKASASDSSVVKGAVAAAGRAMSTTSYRIPPTPRGESGPSRTLLLTSLSRRRARFRGTEPFTWRLTATPTRVGPAAGTANATSASPAKIRRLPRARPISAGRRSRKRRFTDSALGRGQAMATLATAVTQHPGPAPGTHPLQKAVDPPTVGPFGLIGALDGELPLQVRKRPREYSRRHLPDVSNRIKKNTPSQSLRAPKPSARITLRKRTRARGAVPTVFASATGRSFSTAFGLSFLG